ncbi:DUF72 domain-containing protein [Balneola sp. MJW-20]|uniref:DUF72 domain-containing protein n=1 Tax=Gracilimonas aurantiaca TaxID=3234185 RepID=UPI00346668FA
MPEWVGTFYKDKTRPADFLSQYASVFNAVEGNTTFYNTPSPETIRNWGDKTPKGFKFCFKFPRDITHMRMLHKTGEDAIRFVELFEPIRDKLGPFMIQLPPDFNAQFLTRLESLLSDLPKIFSYSVEVRHKDFFDHGNHERSLNTLLKSYGADRVIFDTRKLHSSNSKDETIVAAQKKKPKVPIRFENLGSRPVIRYVGTNDKLNNEAYLREWAIIVAEWIHEGIHPYMFIHSPDRVSQPTLCNYFHELLSELIQVPPLPEWPVNREAQLGLF